MLECEHFLFCVNNIFFDKVIAKSQIFGLSNFSGCAALDIIRLINMPIVYRPLKVYIPNSISLSTMLLSIRGVNYGASINIVYQQFIFKIQEIFNVSSLSQVPKLKILQLCDLISCKFIILSICYFSIL